MPDSRFVQASNVIAAQIYVASDAPRCTFLYPSFAATESHLRPPLTTDERGNRILIIICSVNVLLLYPGTKAYYMWRNRQRAKIWDAMTAEASP